MTRHGLPMLDAFLLHVQKTGTCWLWTGSTVGHTYGQWRRRYAHRASWEIHHGEVIPPGMEICHTCDVKLCVNPDHLFLGTRLDNMRDASRKGLLNVPYRRSNRPLSDEKLSEVRVLIQEGASNYEIERRAGVHYSTVSRIKNGNRRALR